MNMKRIANINIFSEFPLLGILSAMCLFFLVQNSAQAQDLSDSAHPVRTQIDSLLSAAENFARTENDSALLLFPKIEKFNKQKPDSLSAKHLRYIKALMFLKKGQLDTAHLLLSDCAKPLADSSDIEIIIKSLNGLANIHYMKGEYFDVLPLLEAVEERAKKNNFPQLEAAAINNLALIYKTLGDYSSAFPYFMKAASMSLVTGDTINFITNLNNIGILFRETGQYENAEEYHRRAGSMAKAVSNDYLSAVSMQHLAELHNERGEFAEALFFLQKALNIYIAYNNQMRIASVYMDIGKLWYKRGHYERAYAYFENAEKSMLSFGYSSMFLDLMLNKGKVAGKLGMFKKAEDYLFEAENMAKEQSQDAILSECRKALAELYANQGEFARAYEHQQKYMQQKDSLFDKELRTTIAHEEALFRHKSRLKDIELLKSKQALYEIDSRYQKEEIKAKTFYIAWLLIILLLLLIAGVYAYFLAVKNKRNNEGLQLKNKLINEQNNEITQQNEEIRSQTDQLFLTNKKLQRFKAALKNTNNAVVIMDGYGEFLWVNKGFTKLYGMTKQEFRKQNLNIFDAANASDNSAEIKQKLLRCIEDKTTEHYEFSTIGAKEKRVWVQTTITPLLNENNEVESLIAIDSDITEIKKYEEKLKITAKKVLEQKNILQKQNMEINAAIRYAGTIQKAILPIPEYIERDIDFFLIYKPKEIVSGDFYWFSNPVDVPYVFIAITDCTGHGVPGAFMSMIGTRLLNSIVNEKSIYDPAEILERMHQSIKQTLKQHTTGNMDGMDISLCRLEPVSASKKKITFSGAKQSAFYYKMHSGKITKLRGDIKTIGGLYYDQVSFTNKSFVLETGDMLYLTSDGMVDQNAPSRKKFGTIQLLRLLEEIADLPLSKQKNHLLAAYENHRKGEPQRDDISFLGLRI